jgi:AraC-like DNA-binding protein
MGPDGVAMSEGAEIAERQADRPYFVARGGLDGYQQFPNRSSTLSALTASYARRDRPGLGLTNPNPRSDLCMALVALRPLGGEDHIWCDGRHERRAAMPTGGLAIVDHRHTWVATLTEPFETVQVFVPLSALNALTDELRTPAIETLICPVTVACEDPVMHHLARALLPGVARPQEVSTLFADSLFRAMLIHLARAYGGLAMPAETLGGRLAPWQVRRAKELLLDDLRADRSLAEVAETCGLSVGYFARAFRATTGLPPHRWLVRRRVERAQQLLESSRDSLSEIALSCGFSDQSHLTRAFRATVGASPGAWRRQRRA